MEHVCQHSKVILFADDANIFITGGDDNDIYDNINRDLCSVELGMECSKLTLNVAKTHYVVFHSARRNVRNDNNVMLGGRAPIDNSPLSFCVLPLMNV